MATMLRSAAMTLLSKTLLTFLYKYLSDVDVEGIEMPSLYGSTEGGGSGWGVRLSNVKLREGAELMVLPGSRKAKEKPKSSVKDPTDGNSTVSSKGSAKKKKKRREDEKHGTETTRNYAHRKGDRVAKQNSVGGQTGMLSEQQNDIVGMNHVQSSSFNTNSNGDELESTSGSLESLEVEGTRPETPTQNSSISFLSCFAPGSAKAGKNSKQTVGSIPEQNEQEQNLSTEASVEEEGEIRQFTKEINARTLNGHAEIGTQVLCDAIQESIDEKLPQIPDLSEDEDEEDEGDQSDADEDYDAVESPPMALRIGENGSIGTLDVR
jgi:hypothetical protein